MGTCPSGYSWIGGRCVKNPGPNPPLVEPELIQTEPTEDVQEDQSEDEG